MHRRILHLVCVGLWLAGWVPDLHANSASPFPVRVEQPDGQPVTLFVRGTEKLHWYEFVPEAVSLTHEAFGTVRDQQLARTPGFTVVQDAQGRYVFASAGPGGELQASDRVVGQDQPPTQQRRLMPPPAEMTRMALSHLPETGFPPRVASPTGEVRNLVVLMRFNDHANRSLPSRQDFDKLFNASGGDPALAPTGSVHDYYKETSYGKLILRSTVTDWVTLPKKEAYYANGASGLDARVREAMVDALKILSQKNLVNFKDFDNENGGVGDGWIDAITFVHSGYAAEFGGVAGGADAKNRIWSHRWVINTWTDPKSGVRVRDYNINPGLWGISGNKIGRIGVICHELGHFFGLPDLYDYSGQGEGIGSWCLMANSWGFDGSQLHPPHMSAWSKIFLTWANAEVITEHKAYSVPATALPNAKIYRVNYPSGSSDEYLLIENRRPIGNFDGGIVEGTGGRGGLAIWHIDDSKTANDAPGHPDQPGFPANGNHYWVALLQADGKYDLEKGVNRGDGDDVYCAGHVDTISSTSVPSSSSYAGVAVPVIRAISAASDIATFELGDVQTPSTEATFAGSRKVEVPTSHAVTFSPDRKAVTLLFDRLLSSISGRDHTNTTAASFVLPLKGDGSTVHVDLRGFVSADTGSAASLAVQIGGRLEVVDLEAARATVSSESALHDPAKKNIAEFQSASGLTEGFEWFKRFQVSVPAGSDLTVTAVLITEKQTESTQGALVVVDSLDAEIESQQP